MELFDIAKFTYCRHGGRYHNLLMLRYKVN